MTLLPGPAYLSLALLTLRTSRFTFGQLPCGLKSMLEPCLWSSLCGALLCEPLEQPLSSPLRPLGLSVYCTTCQTPRLAWR